VAPTTTSTMEPTTSTLEPTTTTAEPECDTIQCSDECGEVGGIKGEGCGWSKKYSKCVDGARTSKSELGRAEGGDVTLCPDYIDQPTEVPLETMYYKCAKIKCSAECGDNSPPGKPHSGDLACGWSRARGGRCLPSASGAFTNNYERRARLGDCGR
jgi:hypothetical protein